MKKSIIAGSIFGVVALGFSCLFYLIVAGNAFYILVPGSFIAAFLGGAFSWLLFRGERTSPRALAAGMLTGVVVIPLAWYLAVLWKYALMGPTTGTELDFGLAIQGAFHLGISSYLKLLPFAVGVGAVSGLFIRRKYFPMMP